MAVCAYIWCTANGQADAAKRRIADALGSEDHQNEQNERG
jgi:hypothetical protein